MDEDKAFLWSIGIAGLIILACAAIQSIGEYNVKVEAIRAGYSQDTFGHWVAPNKR